MHVFATLAGLLLASAAAAQQAPASSPVPSSSPVVSPAAALRTQDVAALAALCVNCHGPQGHAPGEIAPLYGQPRERLLARMQAFQAGTAAGATIMPRLLKGYDAQQLQALAQWFSQEGQR